MTEESEIYIIEIYSGATLKRTVRNPNADVTKGAQWQVLYDPTSIVAFLS
jgi:hypothetical protein